MMKLVTPLLRMLPVGLCLVLSACVLIRSSAISESSGGGSPVGATHSDYGILRLSKPEGLTSAANADLVRQCQSGLLTDVQTELSMRDWFLIVQYYTLTVNAICKPPPPPPVVSLPAPQPPQKIVLRGVHFDFNKAIIREVDKPVLDEAAETLKANPNAKMDVNGYCDAIGGMRYNQRLSERRANAVAAYLEDKGIPSSQLMPQGFGKTHFVAPNDTAEGRAQNRRVELVPEQ
jgi:outer membrane protein OmpA-like peptidoglycan-associated protein